MLNKMLQKIIEYSYVVEWIKSQIFVNEGDFFCYI